MVLSIAVIMAAAAAGIAVTLLVSIASWLCRRSAAVPDSDAIGLDSNRNLRALRWTYLVAYLMATSADWLQGPYIFVLYESYGFSKRVSASFFVVGFASSMTVGTFLGIQADRYGRRQFAVLYCLLYIVTCLSKHFNSYVVLLIGHSAAGAAISLLYCVFDSWLVSEHNSRGFEKDFLVGTFSLAAFGNSMVAVIAGEMGEMAADFKESFEFSRHIYLAGYCSPFDVALVVLICCIGVLLLTWKENYSQSSSSGTVGFCSILGTLFQQPELLACGIVCASFEASMFVFVVYWTPALQEADVPDPPFGHVFASFMIMCMLGSRIFTVASRCMSTESIGLLTLVLAASSHMAVSATTDTTWRFFAFLIFELSVGIYWPMMGTLKSSIVPEDLRSSIYSIYRVPLNIAVLATLLSTSSIRTSFLITTVMLVIAGCAQTRLVCLSTAEHVGSTYAPVSTLADVYDQDSKKRAGASNGTQVAVVVGSAIEDSDEDILAF